MALEIERKFLLASDAWRAAISRSERLVQGYLGGERASVRVRIGGEGAFLNIKARVRGAERLDCEYPIPLADAEQILDALSLPGRIEKVRHHVHVDGAHFEIDEFGGDNTGLVVAEIELDAVDAAFPRPPWLGREVTHETRYYNVALAERPYAQWTAQERG
jgi:adenylate cyclase